MWGLSAAGRTAQPGTSNALQVNVAHWRGTGCGMLYDPP